MGLELICIGISMVVGIFVGVRLGVGVDWLGELEGAQNLLKGLVLVGLWVVGRG